MYMYCINAASMGLVFAQLDIDQGMLVVSVSRTGWEWVYAYALVRKCGFHGYVTRYVCGYSGLYWIHVCGC